MGDFFEIGVGKPYKIRAEDSEKLYIIKGGFKDGKVNRPGKSIGSNISSDSIIRTAVIIIGLAMIGIGWYKKAKCDKKVFKYMEEHEKV